MEKYRNPRATEGEYIFIILANLCFKTGSGLFHNSQFICMLSARYLLSYNLCRFGLSCLGPLFKIVPKDLSHLAFQSLKYQHVPY